MKLPEFDRELVHDALVKLRDGDQTIDETLSLIVNIVNFRFEVLANFHREQIHYLTDPPPVVPLPDFRVGHPDPTWVDYTEVNAWHDELVEADRLKRAADNS